MEFDYVILFSRWLHLIAVIAAIGGAIFQRVALLPAASSQLSEDQRAAMLEAIRSRWARFTHMAIGTLVLTGGLNFYLLVLGPRVEPMPYHAMFGLKLMLAMVVFFLASALAGRSPAFESMRRNASKWLTILIASAFVIILISGLLAQVRDQSPKRGTMQPATAITP